MGFFDSIKQNDEHLKTLTQSTVYVNSKDGGKKRKSQIGEREGDYEAGEKFKIMRAGNKKLKGNCVNFNNVLTISYLLKTPHDSPRLISFHTAQCSSLLFSSLRPWQNGLLCH